MYILFWETKEKGGKPPCDYIQNRQEILRLCKKGEDVDFEVEKRQTRENSSCAASVSRKERIHIFQGEWGKKRAHLHTMQFSYAVVDE